jgi:O-antigen ligase
VTAVAATAGRVRVQAQESRLVPFFFFATCFCCTFAKVQWSAGGNLFLADLTCGGFLLFFALDRLGRRPQPAPRAAAILLAFLLAFLLVYLVGFFNLETGQALDQFVKGLTKWLLHFGFLIAGVVYLSRKSLAFYWRALAWFLGGIAANGAYGILQLLAAQAGRNLDTLFLNPITGGASQINIYGAVNGASVYRPNALTGDPNHLGIELLLPILILTPLYLRLERGHRLRTPLAVLLAFLLLVELATLSRSGLLGLTVGAIVLLIPYRHLLFSRLAILPLVLVAIPVAFELYHRRHFFSVVLKSRVQTGGSSTSAHLGVYDFIPQVLHQHPLFGLGFNNFSVYYEFVTGKTNWGPHSYYVMLIVEGGLVGTALFAVFLWWLFKRLGAARRLGQELAAAGDPLAARLRPLSWGMTAALAGTLASNAFYLTIPFLYFSVFVMFALALPAVFAQPTASRIP